MGYDILWRDSEQPAGPPLVAPADPSAVDALRRAVYESYEAFLRSRLAQIDRQRPSLWRRDYGSPQAYERSVEPMRRQLKRMLGFWVEPEERTPVQVTDVETLLEESDFTARRMQVEVLPGLHTYAVELAPRKAGPRAGLLAQHGYGGTPELVCGLAATSNAEDYAYRAMGLRAVRRGYHVVAVHHPTGYGTLADTVASPLPGFPQYPSSYGKNRLHRLALLCGGTLFGLDMMASSRGVDLLMAAGDVDAERIGMYGLSQGGMSALYLPALDRRIRASVASAYFNARCRKMVGPHRAMTYLDATEEDKFFPDLIRLFSDSDLASLIAPRAFAVEAGRMDGSVDFEAAIEEFAAAREHYEKLGLPGRIEFIAHEEGHVCATRRAFEFLGEQLGA